MYLYSESRKSDLLLNTLKGFRGVLVSDFYAAYVRDPDGNKLAAVCRGFTGPQ